MQSRRHEDYTIPSDTTLKLRDRGIDLGHDPYHAMHRRDLVEPSPRTRRSLSPRKVEGSKRLLGVDGRSNSVERRDFGWDLGGSRGERVRSRSPPIGLLRKRSHYGEGFSNRDLPTAELRRRYEFEDYMDMNADVNAGLNPEYITGLKPEYRYANSAPRLIMEENFGGSRLSGTSEHAMSGQKLIVSEDDALQDLFRLPKDLRPKSKYGEGGGRFSSSSANLDINRFKDEGARYPDQLLMDKLSVTQSYREREKTMFYSRDVSYPQGPVSQLKDCLDASQFKDFAGTPSGISRAHFQGSYQDGIPLLTDEYHRNSAKHTEPLSFSGHGQRSISDSARDANMEHKDLAHYRRDAFSPTRSERQYYLNPRPRERDSDDYGYPSDEFYRRMGTREQVDYDLKDLLSRGMRDPIAERADKTEYTYRNLREGNLLDCPSMKKQTVSNYLGANVSTASKGGEYLDSASAHVEFGRRVSSDQELARLGVSKDHEFSQGRLDYCFGRDAGPAFCNERMRNSPEFKYEAEMHRLAVRTQEIKAEDLGTYDLSDRAYKRKYSADAEMSRHNSRNIMPGKLYDSSRIQDLNDRSEEWTGQDSSVPFSCRSVGYDNKLYQRTERTFNGADRHRYSASEDWLSSYDSMEHVQEHSIKPYKPGGRYSKGHLRPGPLSSYKSYRFNKSHVLPKPHNVWIRGKDDNQVDMHENEVDQSEDWVSSAKSEPPEDSEEFKQLVHNAFLMFSKKLNENPVVRKRYKEQGRAGSLFCIVCGRSLSKDFMDTRRLVTHAFMSLKVGLRAQHLGLHKAICVLLGWNSVAAADVITWVPEAIPDAEAMAQKEDLILWSPVIIIHNSSIAENNVDEQVITLEALGDFLRGKGFSGGKFKLCLGKPANHSVTVVKFLGTFSGLQDAERLHKYFVENKHGRADFEQVASSSRKGKSSSNIGVGSMQGGNVEELVLYGYMGIAEDLDKVDIDTKRKCSIKSKKEIQDLADAPVKPE